MSAKIMVEQDEITRELDPIVGPPSGDAEVAIPVFRDGLWEPDDEDDTGEDELEDEG